MNVPDTTLKKMFQLKRNELLKLALENGNLAAFETLDLKEDFQETSRLLGLEADYENYRTKIFTAGQPMISSVDLIEKFHLFLMANICFPEDF